jgi:PiT family inorganic phosphate transporter
LVGGLVGAGLVAGGWDAISLSAVRKVAIFIVVSPLVGMTLAMLMMVTLRFVTRGRDGPRVQSFFRRGQLFSSAALSLGHGGNDAQKTMGVVAAVLITTGHLQGGGDIDIPLWVILLAHAAIAAGTYAGGWRIVHTMGGRITELQPVSGFAAETSAAVALFASTNVGAPVSTTQTVAGGIGGSGVANSEATVDWKVFGHLVSAWVITLPVAALIAAGTFVVTLHLPVALAAICLIFGFVAVSWLTYRSMRAAPGADDISALVIAEDEDDQVPPTPALPSSDAAA